MKRLMMFVCVMFAFAIPASAQGTIVPANPTVTSTAPVALGNPSDAPKLSDDAKKRIVDAVKVRDQLAMQKENFLLKAQLVDVEIERASAALQKLIADETPAGYQIVGDRVDKLELAKLPESVKPEPTKKPQ
jgi:hypothetical protein